MWAIRRSAEYLYDMQTNDLLIKDINSDDMALEHRLILVKANQA